MIAELRAKYEAAAETPTARCCRDDLSGRAVPGDLPMGGRIQRIPDGDREQPDRRHRTGGARARLRLRVRPDARHYLVAPVLGVWTVIAPWVVNGGVATTATIVSNVVVGLIAVLLGLGAMSLGMSPTREVRYLAGHRDRFGQCGPAAVRLTGRSAGQAAAQWR